MAVTGGKVTLKVEADIEQLKRQLNAAGFEVSKLKGKVNETNQVLKQNADQAAASAVRFQTLTQGAINLTTAFVQTETTISNLTKAKTSLKAAMVGVERAEDLLARKQKQLNDELRKPIKDMEKIELLQREIATGMKDLEVKESRVIDQTDQLNDTYKLFALNLLNVSFSAIQTGKAMIDSVPKIQKLVDTLKAANVVTKRNTLLALAAVAGWEILVGQLKIFGEEAAKTYSISGQINKIFGDMNVTLGDYTDEVSEMTSSQLKFNDALSGTSSALNKLNPATERQLKAMKELISVTSDPNALRAYANQAKMLMGETPPSGFRIGSIPTATNPKKQAGVNSNVSETSYGTGFNTDGTVRYDKEEISNEVINDTYKSGIGLGPTAFPAAMALLPLMIKAKQGNQTNQQIKPLLLSQIPSMYNIPTSTTSYQSQLQNNRFYGTDPLSYYAQGSGSTRNLMDRLSIGLTSIANQGSRFIGPPAPPSDISILTQQKYLGDDFFVIPTDNQVSRLLTLLSDPSIPGNIKNLAVDTANTIGILRDQETKAFKQKPKVDDRPFLERYPSGSTISREIMSVTGISTYAEVALKVDAERRKAMEEFDFGTNTGIGLTGVFKGLDVTGSIPLTVQIIEQRQKLLERTPENNPERYLARTTHRIGVNFRAMAQGIDATLSPIEQAAQAMNILNRERNTSSGAGISQSAIAAGATWESVGGIQGGAIRFAQRNNAALMARRAEIAREDAWRNSVIGQNAAAAQALLTGGSFAYSRRVARAGGGLSQDMALTIRAAGLLGVSVPYEQFNTTASQIFTGASAGLSEIVKTNNVRQEFLFEAMNAISQTAQNIFRLPYGWSTIRMGNPTLQPRRDYTSTQLQNYVSRVAQGNFGIYDATVLNAMTGASISEYTSEISDFNSKIAPLLNIAHSDFKTTLVDPKRGINEIDDRIRWTQRLEQISTGATVF